MDVFFSLLPFLRSDRKNLPALVDVGWIRIVPRTRL